MSATVQALRASPAARPAADGHFEGYASLFHVPDYGRDIVLPGAFRDSLRARGPRGVKMLFQHDPAEPIGVWTELREDERGLYARGHLATEVNRAREILALLRAGALDGLSIGFRAAAAQRDRKSGLRRLYTRDWAEATGEETLIAAARAHLIEIAPAHAVPGDVLVFRYRTGRAAKHTGLLAAPGSMIHAMEGAPVAEVALCSWWRRHIAAAFAFPDTF